MPATQDDMNQDSSNVTKYSCSQCPKTFKTKWGLTRNLSKHTKNNKSKQQPQESSFPSKRRRVTGELQSPHCNEPGFKNQLAFATHIGKKHQQQSLNFRANCELT